MYPDWPESEADLVPLPQASTSVAPRAPVDGPKLPPFNFQGPQAIKFIEHIGEGLHAHVFKVEILGQLYALKLFRFPNDCDWQGLPEADMEELEEKEYCELYSALYNYAEPFTCECRAFGRIQESGHETVALKCYGYVLLDEEHERRMMAQFQNPSSSVDLDFNGSIDIDASRPDDVRLRVTGKSGRPPPIRGIVKELGVPDEENLRPAIARGILRDIIRLQKLGIIGIDVMDVQIVSGKLCDFSTAVTTPHFLTTPDINPHLTAEMVSMMEFETFNKALNDYKSFDDMIREWNLFAGKARPISITAFPGGRGSELPYNLRNKAAKERIFTYVDPRSYDWRTRGANLKTNGSDVIGRRRSARLSNGRARQGSPRRGAISRRRKPLTCTPSLWHFDCQFRPRLADMLRAGNPPGIRLQWYTKDGFLFPYEFPYEVLPRGHATSGVNSQDQVAQRG